MPLAKAIMRSLFVFGHKLRANSGGQLALSRANISYRRSYSSAIKEDQMNNGDVLSYDLDTYKGVVINEIFTNQSSVTAFRQKLEKSLQSWRREGRKGVWLRIPIEASALIPVAVESGFLFHHSRANYLLMCNWLGEGSSSLPAGPSHYVGVAGVVINSNREVLVIKEKSGPAAKAGLWKIPGGLCDIGEDISVGVVREVKEETGMECEFEQLVCMVQGHKGHGPQREAASDLYCVSILRCKDETKALVPQEGEIADIQWMPVDVFLSSSYYSEGTAFGEAYRSALSVGLESFSRDNRGDTNRSPTLSARLSVGLTSRFFPLRGRSIEILSVSSPTSFTQSEFSSIK